MGFWKKHLGKGKASPSLERVVVEEERFGPCVFEKEENETALKLVSPALSFGRHGEVEIEIETPNGRLGEALRCLAEVCDEQEKYLEKFYEGILSFCEEWEETDSQGNAVTMKLVEKNSSLFRIGIGESWNGNLSVSFNGMMVDDRGDDLLGCHSVIMEMDCKTGEVEYDLEG